ncbi:MAG: hypothetical protein ACI3XJ_07400 [Oscillospiraceae bacterium]
MSSPRYGWWGYAKHMIRRYPDAVNENERAAVEAALAETERMRGGEDRLKIARMVLFRGTHTLAGAALQIPCSERTAQRYHADFIRAVGRNFRCDGLL